MCPSAPRVCIEPGGQKPLLSLSLDLIHSFYAPSPCVARMPRGTLATDTKIPRIRLGKCMQNLLNIVLPTELFLCAGKSMHAKSLCSLPGKVWKDLQERIAGCSPHSKMVDLRLWCLGREIYENGIDQSSLDCAKTTARRDEKQLSFVIWCMGLTDYSNTQMNRWKNFSQKSLEWFGRLLKSGASYLVIGTTI